MNLKNKNLLFINHSYNSFQKYPIEEVACFFNKIYVLVRYKPIAEISNIFPINYLKPHRKKMVFQLNNKPKNVIVIPVPVWYLPSNSSYRALGDKMFDLILKIINKNNITFDLIHSNFVWTSGYVGAQLKAKYHKPLVIQEPEYGLTELPLISKDWSDLILKILNSSDTIITGNKIMKENFKNFGTKTPIEVIPYGFNSDIFYPKNNQKEIRKKLFLPIDKKIILSVGYLDERKGHKYLIDAVGKLIKKRTDIKCLIIGSGGLYKKLCDQIDKLNLNDYCSIIQNIPDHKVIADYMRSSDLFVLSSLTEGFGIVLVEAMACGKPGVATINGGSEEIIKSETMGILCRKGNDKELADAIDKALNKKWNKDFIINCTKPYSWKVISNQSLKIYEKILIKNKTSTL